MECIRVVSCNIRLGAVDDGPDHWDLRRGHLLEVLTALQPDILGVQEAHDFQVAVLDAAFPAHDREGLGREDGVAAGEWCALYWRRDRFCRRDGGTYWLSETPEVPGSKAWGANCTRIGTWADLESADGTPFRVTNLHWDHESALARLRSAEMVVKRAGARNAVVLGDFNAVPETPEIETLRSAGFRDAMADLPAGLATYHGFLGAPEGDRIDYIWTRGGITVEAYGIDRSDRNGRFPSDHFPIWADLVLASSDQDGA